MANIGTTNVPGLVWGEEGPVAPTGPALLAGVQADYDVAFNVSFDFNLNTPQGQLTSTIAAVINNTNQLIVYYVSQVDPAYATGRMQDAIARIYFLERNPAESTVVQALCTGLEGIVIPVGALALAEDGNLYTCTQEGTISASGNVTVSFACNVAGPIECPADSLNQIYQAIPGWDTVNNVADGVIGRNVESRADFEARRAATVAQNSIGSLPSVQGAVLAVDGVLDAYVTENNLDTPASVGGVTLAAHSIYVAVVGGLASEVAEAIWSKKAPGCAYNGNTTVTVTDENAGYSPPYPEYEVKFEIPDALPILFKVSIVNSPLVPADATTLIQDAIISAFAGEDGGTRARIGSTIYASRYYAPIAALGSWAQIVSITVGGRDPATAVGNGTIAGTTLTISSLTSGAFAVGQTIFNDDETIAAGTRITALGTGTGGVGTYTVSISQTLALDTFYGSVNTSVSVAVDIDRVPTINAANIVVALV